MLLLLGASAASAQTRLYLLLPGDIVGVCRFQECVPSTMLAIDVDARRVTSTMRVQFGKPLGPMPLGVTPDGRQLVWRGGEIDPNVYDDGISVFDTSTGQQTVVWRQAVPQFPGRMVLDPSTPRAYVQSARFDPWTPITVLDAAGQRRLPGTWCDGAVLSTISGDGSRLLVECVGSVSVIDSQTGDVVGSLPTWCAPQCLLNEDGSELYSLTGGNPMIVRRYDVQGGTVLAEAGIPFASSAALALDARTSRVVVATDRGGVILDAETLTRLRDFQVPPASTAPSPSAVVVDPQRPHAYVVWGHMLSMVDTDTAATLASATLPGSPSGIVLGPRPPRPINLVATRSGRTVTLEWANEVVRARGTGILVEAGSAPARSDLARLPVEAGGTTLVVPDVPPGTYYVRVRGVNGTGVGDPSNEVVIVVP